MNKISLNEVRHIAKLSKLEIKDKNLIKFQKELSEVIEYIGKLSEVDTSNCEPTSQTTGLENVTRDDEMNINGLTQDTALSGTDVNHNGYFVVDAVLDKES
jgi:aspartyl-tRNA(Asn)/glutamyl-tRNA(Gln) amidotransferase subunit C